MSNLLPEICTVMLLVALFTTGRKWHLYVHPLIKKNRENADIYTMKHIFWVRSMQKGRVPLQQPGEAWKSAILKVR